MTICLIAGKLLYKRLSHVLQDQWVFTNSSLDNYLSFPECKSLAEDAKTVNLFC